MGFGDPFPLETGADGGARLDAIEVQVASKRGSLLAGKGGEVEWENGAIARILETGYAEAERRAAQVDPTALSSAVRSVSNPDTLEVELLSPLERWERIVGISPLPGQEDAERRSVVAARLRARTRNSHSRVYDALFDIFGSWLRGLVSPGIEDILAGDAVMHWPPGAGTEELPGDPDATYPWTSGTAVAIVQVLAPAATPQADIDRKISAAHALMDDLLPSWAVGVVAQLDTEVGEPGFFVGTSDVGITAI